MVLYTKKHKLNDRIKECKRILAKYPNRVPIIVEKDIRAKNIPTIDKKKYLVPNDLTLGQFMYVIRKRIKISAEKGLYIFVNETVIPASSKLISAIYSEHKSEDGFLYITYTGENTFG